MSQTRNAFQPLHLIPECWLYITEMPDFTLALQPCLLGQEVSLGNSHLALETGPSISFWRLESPEWNEVGKGSGQGTSWQGKLKGNGHRAAEKPRMFLGKGLLAHAVQEGWPQWFLPLPGESCARITWAAFEKEIAGPPIKASISWRPGMSLCF
jgi:hypothetical protein